MATLMTKPTHFFLGLLSNLFNNKNIVPPADVESLVADKTLKPTTMQNSIPSTPTLEEIELKTRKVCWGFRYGASLDS